MKYIIDIPFEIDFIAAVRMECGLPVELKCIKPEDLEPYTEPDRKTIEDGVWGLVQKVGKMTYDELDDAKMPQTWISSCSYQEVRAKYESWLRQKDEIRVGCEVHHKELPDLKIYVTDMDDNSFGGFALCRVEDVCDYGDRFSECNVHQYKPTGRVLPNIVELLHKMQEK